jgi:hypothetical protein
LKLRDARIGMRVKRSSGVSTFVRDTNTAFLRGRRIGIITSLPKPGTSYATVQWEGTDLTEQIALHRLAPIPVDTLEPDLPQP